ncbi:hypothetical protein YB2330_003566 [Saitoella coloradoensis]
MPTTEITPTHTRHPSSSGSSTTREKEKDAEINVTTTSRPESTASDRTTVPVPLSMKLISILLVSLIGFGGHWSSGVTGAMKSTLKKELKINNTKYALLTSSQDFMVTVLILFSGMWTDRVGGASAMLYGNALFSVGSILIAGAAQCRSFKFMIFGTVVESLGDIATQVAQYKIFSSWFPPSAGFAATLGFELGIGKIGSFVGKSSANIIAKNTGDFAWVYWTAVFMNIFTNVATLVFWFFTKYANKKFHGTNDPATGEKLTESNKKFEIRKVLELPWTFWMVMLFTAFQTSTAIVFSQNSTELAEQRFNVDSIKAGWYSAMTQYIGFFLVPLLGVFIDILGNRITVFAVVGLGCFLAMILIAFGKTVGATAAAFGIYGVAYSFGPTVIIDGIRTTMHYQGVFGSAYAIKIAINNSMNIIIAMITGALQDADNNSYDRAVIVYAADSAAACCVVLVMVVLCFRSVDMRSLQWTRKQRIARGHIINERKEFNTTGEQYERNKKISGVFFGLVCLLIVGAWAAYIWGAATGNNY